MKARHTFLRRIAAALSVVLCLTLAAPAFAAEPARPAAKPPVKTSLSASAMAKAEALEPAEAVLTTAQVDAADDPTSSPAFFKTGKGAAVLVLLAAGVGYSIYSAFNDRDPVKSPIR